MIDTLTIDIKAIVKKYQQYVFMAKNTVAEKKQAVFKEYHTLVKSELRDFVKYISDLPARVSGKACLGITGILRQ